MPHNGVPRFVKVTALVVAAGLAVLAGVSYEIAMQRQAAQDRAECVTNVLYDAIKATNERTTYSEELSTANENQLKAFQALVVASLRKPPPDEEEARQIVINYRDALDAYFKVSAKAKEKRKNFPYPSAGQVAACR